MKLVFQSSEAVKWRHLDGRDLQQEVFAFRMLYGDLLAGDNFLKKEMKLECRSPDGDSVLLASIVIPGHLSSILSG